MVDVFPFGWIYFFFCLDAATSPGLLRNGRSGAEKRTRFVALRSNSIFQHRPAIPPLTPLRLGRSIIRQGASLLAFCFGFVSPSAFASSPYSFIGVNLFISLSVIGVIESSGNRFSCFTCIYSLIIGLGVPFGGVR